MHSSFLSGKIPTHRLQPVNGERAAPLVKLELTDEVTYRQDQTFFSPHRKDYYVLLYVRKGSGRHWIDRVPYEFEPHAVFFTTPQQVHLKEEAAITVVRLSISTEFLALQANQSLLKIPLFSPRQTNHKLVLTRPEQQTVEELLDKLVREQEQRRAWQADMIYAYTHQLLFTLSRIYTDRYGEAILSPDRTLYQRFQQCLEENYHQVHEVNGYADRLALSVSHLNTLIKEQSGKTVLEHIHERLMLEAKQILFHTERSVKEIAFELGFRDDAYFNRFFRRLTGQTPTAYRTHIREMYR